MGERLDRAGGPRVGRRCVGWAVVAAVMAGALAGCPTYEDSYSGTYRERSPNPATSDRGRQSVQIDFFRYGDHAKAILRYFEPGSVYGKPFGNETFCTWTQADADAFRGDSRQFELPVRRSTKIPSGRLDGEIVDETSMKATLYNTDSGEKKWETITLDRYEKAPKPNPDCEGIEEFLVRPTFDLPNRQRNGLPMGTEYKIENPVLTLHWASFQRVSGQQNNRTLVRVGDHGWSQRVPKTEGRTGGIAYDGEEFRNSLSILLSPPPDKILTKTSSTTAFAVGHLLVVDDSNGEGRFRWNVDAEPIVASALQNGVRPGGPEDATGSGKAILYVDGDIEDLAKDLGNFQHSEGEVQPRLTGLEELADSEVPDRSFFVVDVSVNFRNHLIVQMDVQPRVTQSTVPVQATDRYLNEGFSPLPRMLPKGS
ncbi:MAG: hypothetical protein ABEN55_21470 [Bradymonadaceae bacterium]